MTARDIVEAAVRRELVGPAEGEAPRGKPLEIPPGGLDFESWDAARGPWYEASTGQEILSDIDPLRRYGVGILHPGGLPDEDSIVGVTGLPTDEDISGGDATLQLEPARTSDADADDFDLSDANSYQPSAMAISFRATLPAGSTLRIVATGASYERVPARVQGAKRERDWWIRRPFALTASASRQEILAPQPSLLPLEGELIGNVRVRPNLRAYTRPVHGDPDPECRLITIALVNATQGKGAGAALFQASFEVSSDGGARLRPYPEPSSLDSPRDEERSIALLYRKKQTYAVGHGCAAGWAEPIGGLTATVSADPLPSYDTPSLTPDITYPDGSGRRERLRVRMADLGGEDLEAGSRQVDLLLDLYERWIGDRESEAATIEARHRPAAVRHVQLCKEALARMRHGWQLARTDPLASQAFQLANRAMATQQYRSNLPLRDVAVSKDGLLQFDGPQPDGGPHPAPASWRPFQIAFLLAALPEIVYPNGTPDSAASPENGSRDTVDLIFFPTGGGKTEAYLGTAALSMIARRLHDSQDTGTDVLMRYTLRLLTAQQFLRASSLICALEDLRGSEPDLGGDPFSIGIWLGGETTPNRWRDAVDGLSRLQKDPRASNPFLLLRCPWCGTRMGPVGPASTRARRQVAGYVRAGSRVTLRCPDSNCRFGRRQGLPVHVVDEDVYERRPTLIIGTVDKFAMLAWRPEARSIFGLDADGRRVASPPGLIIQDELHLISGPLGSMVGLYEPVIEDLCTDRRGPRPSRPKIIASTATIRRYETQVRDLYGREHVTLFPPHGLEEGRSFFAEPATLPDGSPAPGRRYLGIMSPSLGSIQTVQVRVAAATLQAPGSIAEQDRDGYWTNLNFLNSLRELGNTVSLLQSDVPDYLTGLWKREGIDPSTVRWPRRVLELTSRRRSDEIPQAIEELQRRYGSEGCIDICLASNIIEVGVDIDRLSLMTIIGQPKATAQYIQVSGRVGRRWWERPGLVLTLYGAAKPRDRSHYERFRSYHQRLYAQVEPTSLTPFALPVLQRGLHGAAIAHMRQSASQSLLPHPYPSEDFDHAVRLLRDRAALADGAETATLDAVARRRAREWSHWERTEWDANPSGGDPVQGLMRYPGAAQPPGGLAPVWDVPSSMRSVDAECELRVSPAYQVAAAREEEGSA